MLLNVPTVCTTTSPITSPITSTPITSPRIKQGAGARKTLLIIGVMAAHAFGEGCGVGVSFCGSRGWKQGLLVTIAIGVCVCCVIVGVGVIVGVCVCCDGDS